MNKQTKNNKRLLEHRDQKVDEEDVGDQQVDRHKHRDDPRPGDAKFILVFRRTRCEKKNAKTVLEKLSIRERFETNRAFTFKRVFYLKKTTFLSNIMKAASEQNYCYK